MKLLPICVINHEPKFIYSIDVFASLIKQLLQSKIFDNIKLDKEDEQWELRIWIVFSREITQIEIKSPISSRKLKHVDYYFWLPVQMFFESIPQSRINDTHWIHKVYDQTFLTLFFDALILMFQTKKIKSKKFAISEESIRDIQHVLEEKMINNQTIVKIGQ